MAPPWGLLPIPLLVLCQGLSRVQGIVPLKTLQCHNDYFSQIVCTWAALRDAQRFLNVTLLRSLNSKPPESVFCDLSNDTQGLNVPCQDCVPRKCTIPYKFFVLADQDNYSFQPDRHLEARLTVTLAQHVQPPAPEDLMVSVDGNGTLLTWREVLGAKQSRWLSGLDFELVYKRLEDSWEDAHAIRTSSSRASLGPEQLLPSSTYVARVRSLLTPGSGLQGRPSQWSPEVRWDSPPGDEAQPQNLQCVFNGAHVLSCSWEVRSEVVSSVSFSLFYKPSPDAREEECSPVLREELRGPSMRFRCHINVSDPWSHGQYNVHVRPKEEMKLIRSSDNIQLASPSLNVSHAGDGYVLSWVTQKPRFNHIGLTFQVQYKKESDSWEEAKIESLQNAHSMSLPHLEPSTRYQARVRVKPTPSSYNGIWSEWSQQSSWDTEWELPMWGLSLILVFLTLSLLPALRFCCIYGFRMNRKWQEKIPNPSKSQMFQKVPDGLQHPGSLTVFSRAPPNKGLWGITLPTMQGVFPVDFGHSEVSPLTTEEPNDARDSHHQPGCAPSSDLSSEPNPQPQSGSGSFSDQSSGFHFNGPYLGPPNRSSLPDITSQLATPQTGSTHQPQTSGSLQYLCLPPGGQVQLVPLAQAMAQGPRTQEGSPCPGPDGGPSSQSGEDPVPPASGPGLGGQNPEDSPSEEATGSGDPGHCVVASGYVSPEDLVLSPPSEICSVPQPGSLSFPCAQNPNLCPGLASGLPGVLDPLKPVFEDYVELPQPSGPAPTSVSGPASPIVSSPLLSPEDPGSEVALVSPQPEGLLVLQQVGDYCFLPGLSHGPLSPKSKPSSPGPSPALEEQVIQNKKLQCQATAQLPAIQLFKALKQQDYLSLPPWDVSCPGEVC